MQIDEYRIIVPFMTGNDFNEAEVFGGVVWLWLQSDMHKKIALDALSILLLPPIKKQLFALFIRKNKPVGYVSWAFMDFDSERRYINLPEIMLRNEDWLSGDRLWFQDFTSPFGCCRDMVAIMRRHIFPNHIARSLYHRGDERGFKIKTFIGRSVQYTNDTPRYKNNAVNFNPIL